MFKFPIKYYDDNIIFTEDGCYGAFEIKGIDYENKSRDSKIRVLDNLTNFLVDITTEAKILNKDAPKQKITNFVSHIS